MKVLVALDLAKNELQNAVVQVLAAAPTGARMGQIYYNSVDQLMYQYDGSAWQPVGVAEDYLKLSGGTMGGPIQMGGQKITGLAAATANTDAVNYQQLCQAIAGLGTVFTFKGSVQSADELPAGGNNSVGDVWIVETGADAAEYVWTQDTTGQAHWERLGTTVDLSGYLKIADLAAATGSGEHTTMTQKAITEAIGAATADHANYLTIAGLLTGTGASTSHTMTQKAITDALAQKPDAAALPPAVCYTTGYLVYDPVNPTSDLSTTLPVSGYILGVDVFDEATYEQVLCDVSYNATHKAVTVTAAAGSLTDEQQLRIIVTHMAS